MCHSEVSAGLPLLPKNPPKKIWRTGRIFCKNCLQLKKCCSNEKHTFINISFSMIYKSCVKKNIFFKKIFSLFFSNFFFLHFFFYKLSCSSMGNFSLVTKNLASPPYLFRKNFWEEWQPCVDHPYFDLMWRPPLTSE